MKKFYPTDHVPSCFHSTLLLFFISLLLSMLIHARVMAQINAYARVGAIGTDKKSVSLLNIDTTHGKFIVGNQVIVLQMQDDVIGGNTDNNPNFGNLGNIRSVGLFEAATILSFSNSQMVFRNALRNTYNTGPNSRLQVISFNDMGTPNYSLTDDITAVPWNGNTGGVIAFQVQGTLLLRRDIRADGAGFRGGNASNSANISCSNQSNLYFTNDPAYGAKGEGIYCATNGAYARGRGHLLTGGGGGNGFNAGGGGGSNLTAGGVAGRGRNCGSETGGVGGVGLTVPMASGNRLIMGGGGGGGQGDGGSQTSGGNGGGIIIIKANRLQTTFLHFPYISANGEPAADTRGTGNDGAGGGGAAGSIFLQVTNYNPSWIDLLQIEANGGAGGDVDHPQTHGGGGGGGQGAILFSGFAPTGNITYTTEPGQGGENNNNFNAPQAGDGAGNANAGLITGVGNPLPVRLLAFNAAKNDNSTKLTWTATDELNTLFHIQHSTDGENFTTIGTVHGTGHTNAITNYSYTHNMPAPGNNFYRLLMTEAHDLKAYSTIATVVFNDLPQTPLAWPNPAKDHFNIRLTDVDNNTNYEITISDLAGKIVYNRSLRPVNNIITVRTGNLQQGLYIVSIATATRKHIVKLTVQ